MWIHQANCSVKPRTAQVSENRASYRMFAGAATDDSDRTRIKNAIEMITAHLAGPRSAKNLLKSVYAERSWTEDERIDYVFLNRCLHAKNCF
jgi:hypothetical protein